MFLLSRIIGEEKRGESQRTNNNPGIFQVSTLYWRDFQQRKRLPSVPSRIVPDLVKNRSCLKVGLRAVLYLHEAQVDSDGIRFSKPKILV